MNKTPTLTDKELEKVLKIFGKEEVIRRDMYGFVRLTSEQLRTVCDYKNEDKELYERNHKRNDKTL